MYTYIYLDEVGVEEGGEDLLAHRQRPEDF
jgi:hypothetical protein